MDLNELSMREKETGIFKFFSDVFGQQQQILKEDTVNWGPVVNLIGQEHSNGWGRVHKELWLEVKGLKRLKRNRVWFILRGQRYAPVTLWVFWECRDSTSEARRSQSWNSNVHVVVDQCFQ